CKGVADAFGARRAVIVHAIRAGAVATQDRIDRRHNAGRRDVEPCGAEIDVELVLGTDHRRRLIVIVTPGKDAPDRAIERCLGLAHPTTDRPRAARLPAHQVGIPPRARAVVGAAVTLEAGRELNGEEAHSAITTSQMTVGCTLLRVSVTPATLLPLTAPLTATWTTALPLTTC